MHNKLFRNLFWVLIIFISAESSFSQFPTQNVMTETNEMQDQPGIPGNGSNIDIDIDVGNNLLSVELIDAEFRSVMDSIAQKAGFKVELSGDVSNKKLTTKFTDIDLERGIGRLMTLVGEKNYSIHYDTKGVLSRIEVYVGISSGSTGFKAHRPVRSPFQRPASPNPPPKFDNRPPPSKGRPR